MPEATKFRCPNCQSEYKVVRVEAPPALNQQVLCLSCGGPLNNREGRFALKYFRVDDGRGLVVGARAIRFGHTLFRLDTTQPRLTRRFRVRLNRMELASASTCSPSARSRPGRRMASGGC
jgi:hypothetical protein